MSAPDDIDPFGEHLQQCAFEYLCDVNGDGDWRHGGEVYEVEEPVESNDPLTMVRKSDGRRFEVDVCVTANEVDYREECRRILRHTYTHEGRRIWLRSKNKNLGGKSPDELLDEGQHHLVTAEARRVAGAM